MPPSPAPLPAHDIAAEMALLGSVLAAPDVATTAFSGVPIDAFWHERHRVIATVLHERMRRKEPIDPALVLQAIGARKGAGDQIGPYLHTLYTNAWAPANAPFYAERLRTLHAARTLAEVCQRGLQRVGEWADAGADVDFSPITADLAKGAEHVETLTAPAEIPNPTTVLDLLAEKTTYDWLVPGLFERGDRLLLTGGEGLGKSTCVTMMTACFAGGIHPFARRAETPLRVAVVDCENSRSLARRRYRHVLPLVEDLRSQDCLTPPEWGERLFIEFRPDGLNLLEPRDVAWLDAYCRATSPDVLSIGPIYKLHATNINDETAARELTRVLDMIRARYRCAIVSEAHAGNAEDAMGRRAMRPIGSSLFRRWPEFGFGLVRAKQAEKDEDGNNLPQIPGLADLIAWRGAREERDWPRQLQHGQTLPWIPHGEYRVTPHSALEAA